MGAGRSGKPAGKTSTAHVPVARTVSGATGLGLVEGSGGSFSTADCRSNRPACCDDAAQRLLEGVEFRKKGFKQRPCGERRDPAGAA